MLAGLEPKKAFGFFEEISRIPRGSDNEKGISDYFIAFAKERGLWAHQDEALNAIIKKPGTKGYEGAAPVILQAHMDMVCEKNAGTAHDFEKDPIKLIVEGDIIRADGTTLGADNGASVAMALALLDSDDIPHPPLEVLFTACEEAGMTGARAVDGSMFESKMLLNMDSGNEGSFCVSCAGGGRVFMTYAAERREIPAGHVVKTVKVRGLKGGHSGNDILKERGNSIRILARVLWILRSKFDMQIADINGGMKENAIPREAQAVIAFDGAMVGEVADEVKRIAGVFKSEYARSDEGLEFYLDDYASDFKKAFAQSLASDIVMALLAIPNGVQAMSLIFDGLPETSLNIGVVTTTEDSVVIASSARSSVDSRKEMIIDQVKAIAAATGASVKEVGLYSAWEYNEKSALRKKAMQVFAQMCGKDAVIRGSHGGLECGLLRERIPGVDIVSFGPDIHDLHTPNETLSISSFARTWDFLLKLLVALAEESRA